MNVNFNCTGSHRKELVKAISEIIGEDAKYQFMPTQAYKIGYYTVDKNGNLDIPDESDTKEVEMLLAQLEKMGFYAADSNKLTIEIPGDLLDERICANLDRIIENRHDLFCHAFQTDKLEYHRRDGKVAFPWFTLEQDGDTAAYLDFIMKLCIMAKEAKRVNAKACETDNEKFTMRCFLIRLGMVGSKYKQTRKVLLRNLTGNSAFRSGKPGGEQNDAVSE
ncbi:MAG TPA: virulence protein [Ruminococcus sp.]|nr:virulence protein [Ruminococcus sp.]